MDTEETNLETQCENMMNIVVESRKRFGKMCIEYFQKSSVMENKILNWQIETFKNFKFKPKQRIPEFKDKDFKEFDDFSLELLERRKRLDELRKKVKNTQEVVVQLKEDSIGRRLREPLNADVLLANKHVK